MNIFANDYNLVKSIFMKLSNENDNYVFTENAETFTLHLAYNKYEFYYIIGNKQVTCFYEDNITVINLNDNTYDNIVHISNN